MNRLLELIACRPLVRKVRTGRRKSDDVEQVRTHCGVEGTRIVYGDAGVLVEIEGVDTGEVECLFTMEPGEFAVHPHGGVTARESEHRLRVRTNESGNFSRNRPHCRIAALENEQGAVSEDGALFARRWNRLRR